MPAPAYLTGHLAVFVPADGARAEDDGWLLTIVTGPAGSELLVLGAADLSRVASVHLPPAGARGLPRLVDRGRCPRRFRRARPG